MSAPQVVNTEIKGTHEKGVLPTMRFRWAVYATGARVLEQLFAGWENENEYVTEWVEVPEVLV